LELLFRDLRLALRTLRRQPVFSLTALLTLGVGIAANTVVFSLVYGALLRSPPFPDADRLMVLYRTARELGGEPTPLRWSFPRYKLLERSARSFERIATFSRSDLTLRAGGDPELVASEIVSAGYFATLGVTTALGRTFAAEEDSTPGTNPVAVIGHGLWRRRFGGDSSVVGRAILVNDEPHTIVGVLQPGFSGLTDRAELWIPEMMAPLVTYPERHTTPQNFISVVGRLREGVGSEQALAELQIVGAAIAAALPDEVDVPTTFAATAAPLARARIDPGNRRSLWFLFGAVGLLLILACANLAGLGLARAAGRRQEVAVRLALGASRRRLIRQLMIESGWLGLGGGLLGVVLALGALRIVRPPERVAGPLNMYGTLGEFAAPRPGPAMMVFLAMITVAAVFLSGLLPALHAGRTDLVRELKDRTASTAPRTRGAISARGRGDRHGTDAVGGGRPLFRESRAPGGHSAGIRSNPSPHLSDRAVGGALWTGQRTGVARPGD